MMSDHSADIVSPGAKRSPAKIQSIQYVRAVASLIVVGWHSGWSYTFLGQAGVDLFFVVSGFVMMAVSDRESSPGGFMLARCLRIVPLYWAATIVVAWLDHPQTGKVLSSMLFWPDFEVPLVYQGWSLNLEMVNYLLVALTLFWAAGERLWLLTGAFGVLCVAPLVMPVSEPFATWANPIALEFLAGAWLHQMWRSDYVPVGAAAWVMGIAGIFVLGASHLLGGGPVGWLRVAFWGVPALVIVAAGLGIERAGHLPRSALLGVLGEASYSIYLTHGLALRLIPAPVQRLWAPLALGLGVFWCCCVGCLVHYMVERPVHRFTNKLLRRSWSKVPAPLPLHR